MKRKDVLRAAREYPKLRDALEETTTELDESRMKCAELERRCYALELQNESLWYEGEINHINLSTFDEKFSDMCCAEGGMRDARYPGGPLLWQSRTQ